MLALLLVGAAYQAECAGDRASVRRDGVIVFCRWCGSASKIERQGEGGNCLGASGQMGLSRLRIAGGLIDRYPLWELRYSSSRVHFVRLDTQMLTNKYNAPGGRYCGPPRQTIGVCCAANKFTRLILR